MPVLNEMIAGVSANVSGTITNAVTGAAFEPTTLEFTLYDKATSAIINSRDGTSLTPGTYAPSGVLSHGLTAADMALYDSGQDEETHVIRYKWTGPGGADVGIAELQFIVLKDKTP